VTAILAVDPGLERSAWIWYGLPGGLVYGIDANDELVRLLGQRGYGFTRASSFPPVMGAELVIEKIEGYGMAVGADVFETVFWTGRFFEAWGDAGSANRLARRAVKLHLCGVPQAKDANIRQALIDRFGPGRETAIGTKKAPGPLYGVATHVWSALAVAVTWADQTQIRRLTHDQARASLPAGQ
jgi:hypothetical protein